MWFLYGLLLVVQTLALTVPPLPTLTVGASLLASYSAATATTMKTEQAPFSAVITIAPLSVNPIARRQKCFDDRGFSVNCATWTG